MSDELPPPHLDDALQRWGIGWAAAAAVVVIVWIVLPVGLGIFFGVLMAFTVEPGYRWLRGHTGRSGASALAIVVGSTLAFVVILVGIGTLLVLRSAAFIGRFGESFNPAALIDRLSTGPLSRLGVSRENLAARLKEAVAEAAKNAAALAERVVSAGASALLALLFATLTMYFVLRNWSALVARAETLLPMRPAYTRALLSEFRRVGRTTLLGTIVTSVAQGLLACAGYFIGRVPEPALFGAATAVASLVPVVGTLLVWIPIGIATIALGHPGLGTFQLVWGALVVVGLSDYVIRPRLVGAEGELPTVVVFAALFGGVEVFGLKGLVLGPVLMSLSIAVLRIYARDVDERARRIGVAREPEGRHGPS